MDYHLEYGLRFDVEEEYKSLYSWSLNEIRPDGSSLGRDQIPWTWTLRFSVTSSVLTDSFEIDPPFSFREDEAKPPEIAKSQVIRMTLRPGSWSRGKFSEDVRFSMFGTDRWIQDFTLEIRPLDDPTKDEYCRAWGGVSYTSENGDFQKEKVDDCLWFYLLVKPETFARYVDMMDRGGIDAIYFDVSRVLGFYSDWSPTISTNRVKVLVRGDPHEFEVPPDVDAESIPRLGEVRGARLYLLRQLKFGEEAAPPPAMSSGDDMIPPPRVEPSPAALDPNLLPTLTAIKKAAWAMVALLAFIAVTLIQKH